MAYWIKITYDRNTYLIDLDRVAAFCYAASGKISFTLPDHETPVILTQQGNPDAYRQVVDYVEQTTGHDLG